MDQKASNPLAAGWTIEPQDVKFDEPAMRLVLEDLTSPCFAASDGHRVGLAARGVFGQGSAAGSLPVVAATGALDPSTLGDPGFCGTHGVQHAYYAGAMANGIAGEELVIALGRAGFMGSFGAGGLTPDRVEQAIQTIQQALPDGPYAFNLIHSPQETDLENKIVDLYLTHGVRCVEAAAFMALTPAVVRYRAMGLVEEADGTITAHNRIIAKVSRKEVARRFMEPAPERALKKLLAEGALTETQAGLARRAPMCDDVTVEADSGGHTDNRALVAILPSIKALADEVARERGYAQPARVGAAGGIGTPEAALAAFVMGAAYVVTGSVNQACVESAASEHTKKLLAQADMADVAMAPAADMFEMGARVQVLKRGTLFAPRAQKLYDLYNRCACIEDIPEDEKKKLEEKVFRQTLDQVWEQTASFFKQRDPHQLAKAEGNPKRKMALIFRWYLGLASRWSNVGEQGREMDYQIWCGAAMGAFNSWIRGTYLEDPSSRRVADVARQLMGGAAYLWRLRTLETQGVELPNGLSRCIPRP